MAVWRWSTPKASWWISIHPGWSDIMFGSQLTVIHFPACQVAISNTCTTRTWNPFFQKLIMHCSVKTDLLELKDDNDKRIRTGELNKSFQRVKHDDEQNGDNLRYTRKQINYGVVKIGTGRDALAPDRSEASCHSPNHGPSCFVPNLSGRWAAPNSQVTVTETPWSGCGRRLNLDTRSARPLCFGEMNHTKVRHDYTQKNKTDGQTTLTSVEQFRGSGVNRGKVRSQPGDFKTEFRKTTFRW